METRHESDTGTTRLRVVVVDDSKPVALSITRSLEKHPQIHVAGVSGNGREALELVARHQPDLVVLDIHMPVMDGLAAAQEICRNHPLTRIIVVSMDGDARTRAAALANGAHAFVSKINLHRYLLAEVRLLFPWLKPNHLEEPPGPVAPGTS